MVVDMALYVDHSTVYKEIVRALLLLISNSASEIKYLHNILSDIDVQKYYISSQQIDKIPEEISVLHLPNFQKTMEYSKIALRLLFLYTEPEYEYLILFYQNDNISKEKIESVLAELSTSNTFIKTDELLATCRQYVAFNDFYFEESKSEIKDNSIQIIENLNKALSGESVEEYYFILALSELLPKMKCSYNTNERNIIEFFEDRNIDTEGSIYFTDKIDENKHNLTVLLSKEKLEFKNIISKVYRADGLIAYILK